MANVSKIRNIVIRAIIVLASWGFIYHQVAARDQLNEAWTMLANNFAAPHFWLFMSLVLIMMIINWFIEALKWQKLMQSVQEVPLLTALQAVLTGITVSVFTPNRVGEFLGRVFSIKTISPLRAILVTLVGSVSQLSITIIAGSVGSLIFLGRHSTLAINLPDSIRSTIVVLTMAVDVAIVMLFLNVAFLTNIIRGLIPRRWRRIRSYVRVFSFFRQSTLWQILSMSLIRYLIFTTQYLILLRLFGLNDPIAHLFMLLTVVWFVMAAIPSFALAELGIRSSVAVSIFAFYYGPTAIDAQQTLAIIAASSLIWIINIALPALIGSAFINRLRLPSPFSSIFKS